MTRQECEEKLKQQLWEVWATYKQYAPNGSSLDIRVNDGMLFAFNDHWDGSDGIHAGKDAKWPINFTEWRDAQ